jgi:ubiquinone/menaquinone biosynthesis C-methylase UbiE
MKMSKLQEIFGDKYSENLVFLQKILKKLDLKKTAKILDIGTGGGRMAVILAINGYRVITGEPEGHNWGEWRKLAKKADVLPLIKFEHFRAENLPYKNDFFDAVFMFGSLHHITERFKALRECHRVLNKQGYIVIMEFTEKGIKEIRKKHPTHPNAVNPEEYTKDLPLSLDIFQSKKLNAYIFSKNS